MKTSNVQNIVASSIAANINGAAIVADFMVAASAQAVVTGGSSPTGTVKLQASNDVCFAPNAPTNWFDIGSVAVAADGVFAIPKVDVCYSFIRAQWVATSGTGTVAVNVKTLGF